jgi:hypothetical protein
MRAGSARKAKTRMRTKAATKPRRNRPKVNRRTVPAPPADAAGQSVIKQKYRERSSIAVTWHRLLLTGDRAGRSTYLRFDRTVVGYAVLVFLIFTLPSALVTLMRSSFGDWVFGGLMGRSDDGALALLWVVMWLVASFYLTRLTVALPAMALGRRDITLRTAWRAGRHNSWRLAWGYLLCTAPLTVAIVGLTMWAELHRGPNVVAVLNQTLDLAGMLCGMIAVSFLSLAYRHFFEGSGGPSWGLFETASATTSEPEPVLFR